MSSVDALITSDLVALGEDSRRAPSEIDDTLNAKNMYRDDGGLAAKARRDELADARRRELVMMPLTISHVFAHRVARAATGGAAVVVSLLAVMLIADPFMMGYAAYFVPSLTEVANLEWVLMMTTIMLLVIYLIALWVAQSWYARRMRESVRTTSEPHEDLDTLARGPVEVAQHACRRVDGYALGLTLGGISMLTLVFGYMIFILGTSHVSIAEAAYVDILYVGALTKNLGALVATLIIAAGVSLVVGHEARRAGGSTFLDMLAHKFSLVFTGFLAVTTAYLSLRTASGIDARRLLPSSGDRYMLAICVVLSLIGVGSYVLLWWRRREQRQIGD